MGILIFWIAMSLVVGFIADSKKRFGIGYCLLSLIISPLLGLILVLALPPNQAKIEQANLSSGKSKKCPFCAEIVQQEATVCRYCGRDLPGRIPIEPWDSPALQRAKGWAKDFHIRVAGVSFDNPDGISRQDIIEAHCKPGMPVIFAREPKNPFDSNAVSIWITPDGRGITDRLQIGYVPADCAEEFSEIIDNSIFLRGRVSDVTGGTPDKPTRGVNLLIQKG